MSHLDTDTLMRHADGLLEGEDAQEVAHHLASCQECRDKGNSIQTFAARLNTHWLGTRLRTILPQEWGCPSTEELGEYFLNEVSPAEREELQAHVERCSRCQEVLAEMEEGTATLGRADPLRVRKAVPGESWWDRLLEAVRPLPGPAWAGAAVAISLAFVAGLMLRPMRMAPSPTVPGMESYRIAKPPFTPSTEVPSFGIAPSVKPDADQRFREAMAFYAEPDFPDKAIPKLKEAVTLDPSHDRAQFWLGIAYLLKDEVRSGIPTLETAVALAPASREYRQYLLWAYLRVGEIDKALGLQTQVLERR